SRNYTFHPSLFPEGLVYEPEPTASGNPASGLSAEGCQASLASAGGTSASALLLLGGLLGLVRRQRWGGEAS
ncbi:MAG TPA: hypothetical protein DIU15_06925, partial [Deltaproteobacteria bacterium]|nr:hypothetical protein [Deltaproteobacteria bacterium]